MDNIVRFYWICYWNTTTNEDLEEIINYNYSPIALEMATERYNSIDSPYKKLVACYYDRDVDLMVHKDAAYWAQYE